MLATQAQDSDLKVSVWNKFRFSFLYTNMLREKISFVWVGCEVLRTVIMKSSIFWVTMDYMALYPETELFYFLSYNAV
jgi:hypothetical protein